VSPNAFRVIVTTVAIALAAVSWDAPVNAQTREARVAEISSLNVQALPIEAFDPADRSKKRFGALEFRSGLILTSAFKGFGGLSAIRVGADGASFTALSDKGDWFTGTIVYSGKVITGLTDVKSAPMLGDDGKPIHSKGWFDSESLAFDGSIAYVGLERVNRILRFDFSQGGILSRSEVVAAPPAISRLPFNKGLEALSFVPKGLPLAGTLIAISERGLDKSGNLLAFLIGGPNPGQFTVRRTLDFDVSDCALLPSGELLLLERKFSFVSGIGIRIRRIPLSALKPGALVDGPSIFEADLGNEIDNMEGLDVHRDADGELVLTIISDDNFSMLQRTLLLQFRLAGP